MFIETESTPNPATLKFLPGREVMGEAEPADFSSADAASPSPLAQALFDHGGVEGVFLGRDFVAITKSETESWEELKPRLLSLLMDFFMSGQQVVSAAAGGAVHEDIAPEDVEIVNQIKELLDTRVRPAVAADGGDIVFRGYRNGVVQLMMQGACSGCPSSRATLKHGVENMLRHYVPEVVAVEQVEF